MPARYSSLSSTWKWPWTTGSFSAKWRSWYRFAPVAMTRSTKPASIIAWMAPPIPAGAIAPVTVSAMVASESIIRPKRSQPSASRPPLKAPARPIHVDEILDRHPGPEPHRLDGGRERYFLRRTLGDWAMAARTLAAAARHAQRPRGERRNRECAGEERPGHVSLTRSAAARTNCVAGKGRPAAFRSRSAWRRCSPRRDHTCGGRAAAWSCSWTRPIWPSSAGLNASSESFA